MIGERVFMTLSMLRLVKILYQMFFLWIFFLHPPDSHPQKSFVCFKTVSSLSKKVAAALLNVWSNGNMSFILLAFFVWLPFENGVRAQKNTLLCRTEPCLNLRVFSESCLESSKLAFSAKQ